MKKEDSNNIHAGVWFFFFFKLMDELYRIHTSFSCPDGGAVEVGSMRGLDRSSPVENLVQFRPGENSHDEVIGSEMSDLLKIQIASHHLYPNLVSAYVECRKVISLS